MNNCDTLVSIYKNCEGLSHSIDLTSQSVFDNQSYDIQLIGPVTNLFSEDDSSSLLATSNESIHITYNTSYEGSYIVIQMLVIEAASEKQYMKTDDYSSCPKKPSALC